MSTQITLKFNSRMYVCSFLFGTTFSKSKSAKLALKYFTLNFVNVINQRGRHKVELSP